LPTSDNEPLKMISSLNGLAKPAAGRHSINIDITNAYSETQAFFMTPPKKNEWRRNDDPASGD
jgi:hypothetical protein